jgi:hypothetical protein
MNQTNPGPQVTTFQDAATVRAAANGRWGEILPALGVFAEALTGKHGPCPGCGGRDRFRFDDREGRGTWICGGGGSLASGDGFDLLRHAHGWDFTQALHEVAGALGLEAGTATLRGESRLGPRHALEAAARRELLILGQTLGRRVCDRELAKAAAFRAEHPEWRALPDDHLERELTAARRLLALLPEIYGAELAPKNEGPDGEQPSEP